jgi:Ubiquitin family
MSTSTISLSRKIIIRPLDGQNQVYENIPADATVRDLKERVFVTDGIPVQNQKLIFGPEIMEG